MKYIWKKSRAFLLLICLICAFSVPAYAHEAPDESRTGSITLTLQHDGRAVKGGTVTAFHVGEIHEDDGNYSFAPAGDFADFDGTLEDVQTAALAEKLADFADAHSVQGMEIINVDGKIQFDDLELGLYLIVQKKAAPGYSALSPFLVSLPLWEDGAYNYEVDAHSKFQLIPETEPAAPTEPTGPRLPQTGQLNWPVPVLAVTGMLLFILGWALRFGRGKEDHAK